MKKILAILMTVLTLLGAACAVAEEDATSFEGVVTSFEDYGFQMTVPAEWEVLELAEEDMEEGIFFMAQRADEQSGVFMQFADLGVAMTLDQLETIWLEIGTAASQTEFNGVPMIFVEAAEDDFIGVVFLDASGSGMITIFFSPANDEEFSVLVEEILNTIQVIAE